jgi:SAM-dependent methyltransferase
VTGLDLAQALIETAKRFAADQGLRVRFDVGDVERLPYEDASFDVVSSAHGIVFAVDHHAVATELARVCRPGGRHGVTYWLPDPELQRLMERVGCTRPEGAGRPADWARRDYAAGLLGDHFELDFAEAICHWAGEGQGANRKHRTALRSDARRWRSDRRSTRTSAVVASERPVIAETLAYRAKAECLVFAETFSPGWMLRRSERKPPSGVMPWRWPIRDEVSQTTAMASDDLVHRVNERACAESSEHAA